MLYTRKGDSGTTKTYGCDQRISKSSAVAEALGSLDEINSFLGLLKVESKTFKGKIPGSKHNFHDLIHDVQENLFIIQAEVAGFPKDLGENKVKEIELVIDSIEKKLPPIKTFFISGGTKMAVLCDISRTIARRAERRVVSVNEIVSKKKKNEISAATLSFLNRLSSLLYALARLCNHKSGINEKAPQYK